MGVIQRVDFSETILQARQGDRQALERLLSRWRPLLRLDAQRLVGSGFSSRADSSDVVQDALAQACRDAGSFRGHTEGEWVQWLRRILAFQAAKFRRRHLAAKRDVNREGAWFSEESVGCSEDPLQELIVRDQIARLSAALDRLSENMREVVVRRIFERQSFEEVAAALGCTSSTARVTWTRAIRKLRDLIREPDQDSLNGKGPS
jgi:RNA polymerase sigma-70 factor (ECF subfamily)